MRWDRNYSSSEVEDRRGEGGVAGGGGGVPVAGLFRIASMFGWKGILAAIVIAGFVMFRGAFFGGGGDGVVDHRPAASSPAEDELVHFVGFVFDDVQKTWREKLPGFRDAHMVIFRGSTRSGCGTATASIGPFYCPMDQKVYVDLGFYDELRRRFGAPGDFAQAYVIAHEVGHHVQHQLDLFGNGKGDSIAIELQADCLAGAWAKDAEQRGEVEMGDIDEALNAATQIGDDMIQKRTQGHVQPETWTHGSSAQRSGSFRKGYGGGPAACGIGQR